MKKLLSILTVLFLITACTVTTVKYTPKSNINFENSKKVIERVIYGQPEKFLPGEITITTDYIKIEKTVTKMNPWATGLTAIPKIYRLYFNRIDRIQIYEKRNLYRVFILDKFDNPMYKIYTYSKKDAEKLVDAIFSIKNNRE